MVPVLHLNGYKIATPTVYAMMRAVSRWCCRGRSSAPTGVDFPYTSWRSRRRRAG
ncbi:hypothetical protein [Couchioplanes caeruleus]|uniref:hypothetical protein n=1 Tax=Couchioplanes caeruleus TaxID=56438 RepID=UPI000F4C15D7